MVDMGELGYGLTNTPAYLIVSYHQLGERRITDHPTSIAVTRDIMNSAVLLNLEDAGALLRQSQRRLIASSGADIAALQSIASVIAVARDQQAGWGKLKLIGYRELGTVLENTPRLRGRPKKVSTADSFLPSLAELGILDRHLAADAVKVANVSQSDFDLYLATEADQH
jgi:hypothetical protein